jgi:tetratricopeptide (TPR) repeat protein
MVGSQTMLARALYATGRYREAVSRAKEAIELLGEDIEMGRAASSGDLNDTVVTHVWLALCYAELGEFEIGAEEGETAVRLAVAAECGEHGQVWSRVGLGRLKLLKGDLAGAIEVLTPALSLCKGEFAIYFSRVASSLGAALAGSGRAQEGLELLKRADARALEIGFTFGHALVLAQLTEAFLGLGDLDQAQEAGLRALEAARRWGERGNEGWAGCALAAVAAARNDIMQAQVRYREALSIAEQLEMEPLLERSRAGLNRLAAAKT